MFLKVLCRVWQQLSTSLGNLRSVFSGDKATAAALKKFTLRLASPTAEKLGWEFKPNEDYLTGQLRKLLLSLAGNAGHERQVDSVERWFSHAAQLT